MAQKKEEKKPKKEVIVFARGKRKESVARVRLKKGTGKIRFNGFDVNTLENNYMRQILLEPLELAGDVAGGVDISINVSGGGPMGQIEAARLAIAKAVVEYTGDQSIKERMLEQDRHLLVEDSRRVEPKKYRGRKARARFQKSYR
ncbi:MAG: 30S ribosomal protein S9 [Candidatus Micrarchaeia archaeon]